MSSPKFEVVDQWPTKKAAFAEVVELAKGGKFVRMRLASTEKEAANKELASLRNALSQFGRYEVRREGDSAYIRLNSTRKNAAGNGAAAPVKKERAVRKSKTDTAAPPSGEAQTETQNETQKDVDTTEEPVDRQIIPDGLEPDEEATLAVGSTSGIVVEEETFDSDSIPF